jgi:putative transposase
MCSVLGVSRSGYYDCQNRKPSARTRKQQEVLRRLQAAHQKNPMWGTDPLWAEVKETIPCGRGLVHRLKQKHGIQSLRRKKWKATTNSNHNLPTAPDLLKRKFDYAHPNMVWVGDITYHWTDQGWLYTAIVKDLCTREVVGYAMGDRITQELVTKAMDMALRRNPEHPGLIFHSDRGSQYCSKAFREQLKKHNVRQSMSRRGNPYDNACAENFFSCLKCECTSFYRFPTRSSARQMIFEYIEVYYNRRRRHASLGWISPARFKEQYSLLLTA